MNYDPQIIWLVGQLVKSTGIFLLALILLGLWRGSSAATRHFVWFLAFAGVFAMPFFSWLAPSWELPILPSSPQSAEREFKILSTPLLQAERADSVEVPQITTAAATLPLSAQSPLRQPLGWLFYIWAAAVPAFLSYTLCLALPIRGTSFVPSEDSRAVRLCDQLRKEMNIGRSVPLFVSPQLFIPMVRGLWRPAIWLPALHQCWTRERLEFVLRHELAHIQRRDIPAQILVSIGLSFNWCNPLAWWAASRMKFERERACDDLVLQSGASSAEYASELVAVAREALSPRLQPGAMAMARRSQLSRRVASLLHPSTPRKPISAMGAVVLIAVTFAMTAALAGCKAAPAEAKTLSLSLTRPIHLSEGISHHPNVERRPSGVTEQPKLKESNSTSEGQLENPFQDPAKLLAASTSAAASRITPETTSLAFIHEKPQRDLSKLHTRSYALNTSGLRHHFESLRKSGKPLKSNSQLARDLEIFVGEMAGIQDGQRGRKLYFNLESNILLARASQEELESLEEVLTAFNAPPSVVEVKVAFVQVNDLGHLGDLAHTLRVLTSSSPEEGPVATMLQPEQYRYLHEMLLSTPGVDVIFAPKVTTLSGKETRLEAAQKISVVTGLEGTNGTYTNRNGRRIRVVGTTPLVEQREVGVWLDLVAHIQPDGVGIHLAAKKWK